MMRTWIHIHTHTHIHQLTIHVPSLSELSFQLIPYIRVHTLRYVDSQVFGELFNWVNFIHRTTTTRTPTPSPTTHFAVFHEMWNLSSTTFAVSDDARCAGAPNACMRDSMWTYILKVHLLSVSLPSARFKEGKVFGLEMKCFALL